MATRDDNAFDHWISKRLFNSIIEGHQQMDVPPMDEYKEAILYSAIYEIVKPRLTEMSDQVIARVVALEDSWRK